MQVYGEDPDTLFFEKDSLREGVRRHVENIYYRTHKDVVIRVIPNSYSGVMFAAHRDRSFSFGHIQSTMRNTYRAT